MESILHIGHTALSFICIISVIVFIHEFGHYLAARLCGVKIDAFSIGFGKGTIRLERPHRHPLESLHAADGRLCEDVW